MRNFKIKSELKDNDDNLIFDGYVEVAIPNREGRLGLSMLQMEVARQEKEGALKDEEALKKKFKFLETVVKDHFKSIDLVHVKTGEKLTSVEDLEYFEEGNAIINEMALKCISGVGLGKTLS